VRSSAAVGSRESSLNTSLGSRLQQLTAVSADVTQCKVRMAHYKGTIVAVKLCSSHYPACVTHSLAHLFTYLLTYLLTCVAVKRLTSKGTTFTRRDESEMTAVSHVTSPSLYFLLYFVYFRIFSFIFVHFRFFSFIMPRAATL